MHYITHPLSPLLTLAGRLRVTPEHPVFASDAFVAAASLAPGHELMRLHGELTTLSVQLPRITPLRGRIGARFQKNAFQSGLDATLVGAQNRVFTTPLGGGLLNETTTEGYGLTKLYAAYSFTAGKALNTLAARLDNAANTRYSNHLNFLKDLAPEMGRDFRVTYTVKF
jgi:iron complex outermembrane receptor protein